MKTYISILRGINVSGRNLIKMEHLRKSFESLDFQNVQSYIQSGNVIFSTENESTAELASIISRKIEQDFTFDVPVIVLSVGILQKIIDDNPFALDNTKDKTFLHVSFLAEKPGTIDICELEAKKSSGEEISVTQNAVYLYCPNGYGNTKLNNNFLESKLKVQATTRNWKTVNELHTMALGI